MTPERAESLAPDVLAECKAQAEALTNAIAAEPVGWLTWLAIQGDEAVQR